MMSAKLATLGLLKIKVFLKKKYFEIKVRCGHVTKVW